MIEQDNDPSENQKGNTSPLHGESTLHADHPGSERKQTIFIGVAWPYANGNLHLGHVAGSLLSPDIFSRYHRLCGNRVLMVSGSDEHGTPITVRAEKENKSPQDVVDFFHRQTLRDLESLKIEFDLFTRTTHPNHYSVVQDFFLTLYTKGYIFPKTTTELYCTSCEKFLPDRYVSGNCPHCGHEKARGDQCDKCGKTYNAIELIAPVCKICASIPVQRETEHFFFRLSYFSDRLLSYLQDKNNWKSRVLNFTRNWVLEGLKDRPITRDISWGVPVPLEGYESKRIYVWFDAVIGYFSASKQWAEEKGEPYLWKDFWLNPVVRSYYFLGKDNVPFHTIIWPSMLLGYGDGKGQEYNLPFDVPANEYLQLGGEKFTKSGGIGIEVSSFMKEYTSDEVRYYLSIVMPENRDVDFDMHEFKIHVNNELVATFGNFIHRVLSFTAANFGSIPHRDSENAKDNEALELIEIQGRKISELIESCQFKSALKEIMALASYGNRYLVERAPWKLIKTDREDCGTVMNIGLRLVKALSIFTYPYLPESMMRLHTILNFPESTTPEWNDAFTDFSKNQYEAELQRPKPLYRQLELDKESKDLQGGGKGKSGNGRKKEPEDAQGKSGKKSKKNTKKDKKKINAEDQTPLRTLTIDNLDLRVGNVLEVEDHPDAEKLYVLSIDVGEGTPRALVAGLKKHYSPDELKGRSLIILCNLKPAKLRGVLSQGMMLAASANDIVSFLTPIDHLPAGTRVTGYPAREGGILGEILIDEFAAIPFSVRKIEEIMNNKLILDDGSFLPPLPQEFGNVIGKDVVYANGAILASDTSIVVPEKKVGPGASIR